MDDKKEDKELYSQIIRSYGVLIHDICELVPDGIVVYFPTRDILKECRAEWEIKENIYEKINKTKHIFEESEWEHENTLNLTKFKKYCKIGRGAVFFVSAQSEFAKLETFYGLYSRCIVMVGVPYHLHHL
jgi:DNA excision repair protein ERCC-2